MSWDRVDPENLINERPSLVDVDGQGALYVADARVRENGWLWIKEWDGRTAKLPPHRLLAVRRVATESADETNAFGGDKKRVASAKWREEAKRSPDEIGGEQPVVADD
ncbi:hypothetical protein [Halobellus captivus]|uniref:hypothetical protein n=1 Tax=Halobellus captivus TaxID=2592614 RepID=UPI0011A5FEA0|nr:hypothetical protein [Halobellus captivus]